MNLNYILSLILVLLSCVTILKVIDFIRINKIKSRSLLCSYCAFLFTYCLSFALELASTSVSSMSVFRSINVAALSFLPGLILLIFLDIVDELKNVKTIHYLIIFVIPLVSVIFTATSGQHHLFLYNFTAQNYGSLTYLSNEKGFWFYVVSGYSSIVLTISLLFILKAFLNTRKNLLPVYALITTIILALAGIQIKIFEPNSVMSLFLPFVVPIFTYVLATRRVSYSLFDSIPLAYQKAFDWSDNCKLILNSDLNLIEFNNAALEMIPLLTEDMVSKNISEFIDYDGRIRNAVINNSECRSQIIHGGNVIHFKVSSAALHDSSQKIMGYIVSLIDITELVDTIAELTDLASVDTLTQTHTRRYFIERSEVEFARAKRHGHPLSFIILDLDFFKKINDRYGHLAGDSMLTEIANICKSKIRSIDILGRFGGEEFMLLLPETDLEGAYFAANRIRKAIEATDFIFENSEMSMTVSIGVTGVNKIKDENFDVFLRHADRALYKAKENGRNRVEREKCC